MQYTLLEMVQSILSSMDSDEVNSITDTVEAQQVVEVIKTCYDNIVTLSELPIQKTLFNLTASGDVTKPVLMTKPATFQSLEWLKYDKQISGATDPAWGDVLYLPIDEFIQRVYRFNPSETNVLTFDQTTSGGTVTFFYTNDAAPMFFTTFDDNTLVFDSYDADVDTTLQTSKTLCFGELAATFTNSDTWVPNLHPHQFPLLLNEAKALAWAELKQASHMKAEKMARDNKVHLQKSKRAVPYGIFDTGPDYGRK